jgi:hypothetical protein
LNKSLFVDAGAAASTEMKFTKDRQKRFAGSFSLSSSTASGLLLSLNGGKSSSESLL